MLVINFAIKGLGLFLFVSISPDRYYTIAQGHGAPLYLSYIVC